MIDEPNAAKAHIFIYPWWLCYSQRVTHVFISFMCFPPCCMFKEQTGISTYMCVCVSLTSFHLGPLAVSFSRWLGLPSPCLRAGSGQIRLCCTMLSGTTCDAHVQASQAAAVFVGLYSWLPSITHTVLQASLLASVIHCRGISSPTERTNAANQARVWKKRIFWGRQHWEICSLMKA